MRIHGVLKRLLPMCTVLLVCLVSMPGSVLGADVDVYAEGAYDGTNFDLFIYADINTAIDILSFGVRVDYPAGLSNPVAKKNEDVWYFGAGAADYSYMEPEIDGSGVVIIGGKLNTNSPTEGVTGSRVLLGTITFDYAGTTAPTGITLTYGRGDGTGDFKNFVGTDGFVYDNVGVDFLSVEIHERGDANGDGIVNFQDMLFIREYTEHGGDYTPWADCNRDLLINFQDMLCVRAKTES